MTSTTGTIPPTHRRFNEDQAMEQIRNRYELIREKIPNQLDALQHDAHFREFCGDIYGRGYKDWMILATIYNAVLNLKLHERQVDCLDPDAMSRAMQQISLEPIDGRVPHRKLHRHSIRDVPKDLQYDLLDDMGISSPC